MKTIYLIINFTQSGGDRFIHSKIFDQISYKISTYHFNLSNRFQMQIDLKYAEYSLKLPSRVRN